MIKFTVNKWSESLHKVFPCMDTKVVSNILITGLTNYAGEWKEGRRHLGP